MTIKLKNNVSGFLAAAIAASDTLIVLQAGQGAGFPALVASQFFYVTLASPAGAVEIVKVTGRSGDSLTAQRAQEGTTAMAFPALSRVEMRISAQTIYDVIDDAISSTSLAVSNIASVIAVATSIDSVNSVAGNMSDVLNVSSNMLDINTVENSIDEINAVAGDLTNIDTVSSNIAAVNTVAANAEDLVGNLEDIVAVGGNITSVVTTATNIASVNTVSTNIASVNTVAANVADVTNFANVYYGPKTTDPAVRNDGTPRQTGDLYFNTAAGRMRVFDGAIWTDYEAAAEAAQIAAEAAQAAAETAETNAETAETNAETAEANAETAETNAAASAQAALDAQLAAEAAETGAETARDAAVVGVTGLYASVAAGLAATTTGQYFAVISTNVTDYVDVYLNSSGTAVFQKTYPSVEFIREFRDDLYTQFTEEGMRRFLDTSGTERYHPIVVDSANRIILGYDDQASLLFGAGVSNPVDVNNQIRSTLLGAATVSYSGTGPVWPIATDQNNRVILGYNADLNQLVGVTGIVSGGSGGTGGTTVDEALPVADQPVLKDLNHMLFYGQSLSVGATATTILSTSQPYSNVTFQGGPRAWSGSAYSFSPLKPLVEDNVNPAPDGGSNRGETPCSGAANYATTLAVTENGLLPTDHVILSTTAGHGGYSVNQLDKGTAWYNSTFKPHVQNAYNINSNYAVHAVCWMQGENDAASMSYATYRAELKQLQVDAEADVKAINGQTSPVFFITYQMSFRARTFSGVPLAQLDLAQKDSRFFLSSPCYHIPFASDGVHLTNVGYKWLGAYFGRAYKRLVLDKLKPVWVNPVSATRRGLVLTVRFDVPTLPLVFDTVTLAATSNNGFRVVDSVGDVGIASMSVVNGNEVQIVLSAAPTGSTNVRYALDYLGTGLTFTEGASGNLRDSDPTSITIGGIARPLYNVCPHFTLPVVTLGE